MKIPASPRRRRLPSVLCPLVLLLLPAAMQAQFVFVTNHDNTITITGYTGPGGAVTIPASTNGYPVVRIGESAFYNQYGLTSVTIPNSVTDIGDWAFSFCTGLTSVTMTNSITLIGLGAFNECNALANLAIPNSVVFILSFAFYGCSSLTSVTIPASVTVIGEGPFSGCPSLTAITVDTANSSYSSLNGVLYDKAKTLIIQYPGARAGSYMVPKSVTSIGRSAFYGPSSLTAITVDAQNPVYNSMDGVLFNESQTTVVQYPCARVGSYAVPNGVITIGDFAFAGCANLTSVGLPDSATSIGEEAFGRCANLSSVTIRGSLTDIRDWAFFGCPSLSGVYFQGNAPSLGTNVFEGAGNATVYYLPCTTGWGSTFGGRPTAPWLLSFPVILDSGASFGVQTNRFCFTISWATGQSVVVLACTNLAHPSWIPVSTNALSGGCAYFCDPLWMNYPARYYHLRSP
jgi:hypothetical protein